MRYYLLSTLCFLFPGFAAIAQRPVDVTYYRYDIEVTDRSDSITAKAIIQFNALQDMEELDWDLVSASPSKKTGMRVLGLQLDGRDIPFEQSGNKVKLKLAEKLTAGSRHDLSAVYTGIPADGLIISNTRYGRRSFFADNWPDRAHNWILSNDDPADKAAVEFVITAPEKYQVVSNGIQVEETNLDGKRKRTHWKEEVPVATKVMVIGVAEMAVGLAGYADNCTPVYSYVYPEDRDKGFFDYALTVDILRYFSKEIGPYGYRKLANVQSKTTFGGLENANAIFYAENSVDGKRGSERLMAHEVAHQWFGNMVGEKSFAHLWLSEGFATYLTILYMEDQYGREAAVQMLEKDRSAVVDFARKSRLPVVLETKDYMSLLNTNSYQKGGWVLHMLRVQLGNERFRNVLRKFYERYTGSIADTRDFQAIVEEVSGDEWAGFFDQWLYQPEIPKLKLDWSYSAKKGKAEVRIRQMQDKPLSFPLKLEIVCEKGRRRVESVLISGKDQRFEFAMQEKPSELLMDPETELLYEQVR